MSEFVTIFAPRRDVEKQREKQERGRDSMTAEREQFSIEVFGVTTRVKREGKQRWVTIPIQVVADLLGQTQISLLDVQDHKPEFIELLFDNTFRGVLRVRGNGRHRNTACKFGWANPGFASEWRPSPAADADSADRAWGHVAYLREHFADFYAERAAARLGAS